MQALLRCKQRPALQYFRVSSCKSAHLIRYISFDVCAQCMDQGKTTVIAKHGAENQCNAQVAEREKTRQAAAAGELSSYGAQSGALARQGTSPGRQGSGLVRQGYSPARQGSSLIRGGSSPGRQGSQLMRQPTSPPGVRASPLAGARSLSPGGTHSHTMSPVFLASSHLSLASCECERAREADSGRYPIGSFNS